MSKRKKGHSPERRMPKKIKLFIIRSCAALAIFSLMIAAKYVLPGVPPYVKNQISYNTNLESAKQTAKDVILKYSPTSFHPAES